MTTKPNARQTRVNLGKVVKDVGNAARTAQSQLAEQADTVKKTAAANRKKRAARKPTRIEQAVTEYNAAYTDMSDKGLSLLRQRDRTTDLIYLVEQLVNSVANTPRSFTADFSEINSTRQEFLELEKLSRMELEAARRSAVGAGTGVAAGAAVASMAPTAALWVATTFGTASTGTAISTLSGAAATNAALAWLGGGALAAGGGGTAAGTALLALAGPVGWSIAGATLLTSIVLLTKTKLDSKKAREKALADVKENTAAVKADDAKISALLDETRALRELVMDTYGQALAYFGADFRQLTPSQQASLVALVNNTKACASLLSKHIHTGNP